MDPQAVPPAPAAPTTSLLSLPTELLVRIGRGVAPDGGRKVGALRLACRRLDRAVKHIAWASIHIPSEPKLHNPLISALLWDLDGHGAQVTSVRWDLPPPELDCAGVHAGVLSKLRSLKRLHILDISEGIPSDRQPLPHDVWHAFGAFPHLRDGLVLERIAGLLRPAGSEADANVLPNNIGSLSLVDCQLAVSLYSKVDHGIIVPLTLRQPIPSVTLDGSPETIRTVATLIFVGMALTSAICAEARFAATETVTLPRFVQMVDRWPPVTSVPFLLQKLRLLHLPALFDPDSPTTGAGEAHMLEALSHTPITNLSLPVTALFAISPTLGAVVMRNVTALTLETDPVAPFVAKPDLYAHATHITLINFLSTSFPNLTSLNLRGWFDATGIQGPATATPRILSTQYSLVWSLISALRWTDVVEIRLKSSNGHPDGDSECCFTRADKDAPEWNARLALYI